MMPCSQNGTDPLNCSPTISGLASQDLTINSDAAGSPDNVLTLSGNGIEPLLSLSAHALDFGAVLAQERSADQFVEIQNTGSAPLLIGQISMIGPNENAFEFAADDCSGQTIPIGMNCRVSLYFRAFILDDNQAELVIPSDAPSSPDRVALSGFTQARPVPTLANGALALLGLLMAGLVFLQSKSGRSV